MVEQRRDRPKPGRRDSPAARRAVIRELDQRHNDGTTVTLFWNAETNRVFVSVLEEHDGVSFEFEIPGADAADAFHHPYAYVGHDREDDALAA